MDLSNLSTEEILTELEKRSTTKEVKNNVLVFGTIGNDAGSHFVEVFKEIKEPNDLDFINQVALRARFNSHRQYQGFYFKTDKFKELEQNLNKDNKSFANWVKENNSVKYTRL